MRESNLCLLSLDLGDGQCTFLLLDFVAILPIHVLFKEAIIRSEMNTTGTIDRRFKYVPQLRLGPEELE